MVHVPIFGLRLLARVGLVAVAAAAVPIVLRKCRPLAKQVGDTLVRAGEKLRQEAKDAAGEASPPQGARSASEAPGPENTKVAATKARARKVRATRRRPTRPEPT